MSVSSTPDVPTTVSITPPPAAIKIASPDIILIKEENLPVDSMANLIFQSIGGYEILSVTRNDLVNGQNVEYQPIKDLKDIYLMYNSGTLIRLPNSSESFFNSFPINLFSHIPQTVLLNDGTYGYAENTSVGPGYESDAEDSEQYVNNVYMDYLTGDIVIDTKNITSDYTVQIEIISPDELFDGTI